MTAALSSDGNIVLPQSVRDQLNLQPGDDLNIIVDEDEIILRRVAPESGRDWVDTLLACPYPFEVPEREKDDSPPLEL
ncbi:MAG TPA: AbrB/MazE/SpoVT family DNA-binding domain-containing protein [Chthoniobacteraceae bacterium]|jgi:AbrB family looped-hinge helix DNA binding protein|nr:AbrB/MazE/SpoVT family DNA-binding domain-containing protein [Chthoniobacteraceae bacterium]